MASQTSSMVAGCGQRKTIAYHAPALACGSLVQSTSLASNENIEEHHEVRRMDVDFESCKVRVGREWWIDSQGDSHEWRSLVSESIADMESIIDEFRRKNEVNSIFPKHFDLHSHHLEGVVCPLHVASQNANCLYSEIAKVCGEILDRDKRLVEFLSQLTKDVKQICAQNASLKANMEINEALRDPQVSWLSRGLKCLMGEAFLAPPSPLKQIPLLDRVSHGIDQLEENIRRLDVWHSQAIAATFFMEEACKSCGKHVPNLRGDIEKMNTTVGEFVENEIFKVQDHYEAEIRLMSHEHSESSASMRVAHLRAIENVEKTCHEKFWGCEKSVQEQINNLTHLVSMRSDSSCHISSTIPPHFCDSQCPCIVEFGKAQ